MCSLKTLMGSVLGSAHEPEPRCKLQAFSNADHRWGVLLSGAFINMGSSAKDERVPSLDLKGERGQKNPVCESQRGGRLETSNGSQSLHWGSIRLLGFPDHVAQTGGREPQWVTSQFWRLEGGDQGLAGWFPRRPLSLACAWPSLHVLAWPSVRVCAFTSSSY